MGACAYSELLLVTKKEYKQITKNIVGPEGPAIGKSISHDEASYAYADEDEYSTTKINLSEQDIKDIQSGAKFLALTTTAHYSY